MTETVSAKALEQLFADYTIGGTDEYPVINRDGMMGALLRRATALASAEARIAELTEAMRHIKPYLVYTVGPESPGHHPTMPSAVDAFLAALARARSLEKQDG